MMRPCDYENVSPICAWEGHIVRNDNVFSVGIGKYLGLTALMQNNASMSMLQKRNVLLFSSTKKMILEYDLTIHAGYS